MFQLIANKLALVCVQRLVRGERGNRGSGYYAPPAAQNNWKRSYAAPRSTVKRMLGRLKQMLRPRGMRRRCGGLPARRRGVGRGRKRRRALSWLRERDPRRSLVAPAHGTIRIARCGLRALALLPAEAVCGTAGRVVEQSLVASTMVPVSPYGWAERGDGGAAAIVGTIGRSSTRCSALVWDTGASFRNYIFCYLTRNTNFDVVFLSLCHDFFAGGGAMPVVIGVRVTVRVGILASGRRGRAQHLIRRLSCRVIMRSGRRRFDIRVCHRGGGRAASENTLVVFLLFRLRAVGSSFRPRGRLLAGRRHLPFLRRGGGRGGMPAPRRGRCRRAFVLHARVRFDDTGVQVCLNKVDVQSGCRFKG